MAKQKQQNKWTGGYVYSTDPDFPLAQQGWAQSTLPPAEQKLRIWLETKNRGGKAATVIKGFIGTEEDLKTLGKSLKNHLGTGGAVKDQEIIIQGDKREKIMTWLMKEGFKNSKNAGK